jgi:archaellum biogenesis ATPase FlaH
MSDDRIEILILNQLLHSDSFISTAYPFIKEDFFQERQDKLIFTCISKLIQKYKGTPTLEMVLINFSESSELTEDDYAKIKQYVPFLEHPKKIDPKWMLDRAEKWCRDQSFLHATLQAAEIASESENKNLSRGKIPELFREALSLTFDPSIGHDYFEESEQAYLNYQNKEDVLACNLEMFNRITDGGFTRKTLNVFMAPPNKGKSLFLCHFASSYVSYGKNVLYVSVEMSEHKVRSRIDANLFAVPVNTIKNMHHTEYISKMNDVRRRVPGRLIIKDYPAKSISAFHIKHLVSELALKKKFVPDIIVIDYLNEMRSIEQLGKNSDLYSTVRTIASEIRGLASETNTAVFTATQTNRGGLNAPDLDLDDVSESFGLPQVTDTMFGIITTEELETMGQYIIKVMKLRDNDVSAVRRFALGVDRSRMTLYDVDQPENKEKEKDDTPSFDKTKSGTRLRAEVRETVEDDPFF